MTPKNSTVGYLRLINLLHFLHLPNKKIKDKIGILSNQ